MAGEGESDIMLLEEELIKGTRKCKIFLLSD